MLRQKRATLFAIVPLTFFMLAVLALLSGGDALAGNTYSPSAGVPTWGPDMRINPTPSAVPNRSVQRNFDMAVHPTNDDIIITGYDNLLESTNKSVYLRSTDSGVRWSGGMFNEPWAPDLNPAGDANVAFDSQGNYYYTGFAQGNQLSGYFTLTSTNGITWNTPVPIEVSDYGNFRSKSDFLVDTSAASPYRDRLHMTWVLFNNVPPFFQGIKALYSGNRGMTWTAPTGVSDAQWVYAYGPSMVSAPNGTIYTAYVHVENNQFLHGAYTLLIDKSTDGGQTWGTDHVIGGGPIVTIGRGDFKGGRERVLIADDKCSIMRVFHYPYIATSPTNSDTVYAVWNDGRWDPTFFICGEAGRHSDIAFSRSTDGGVTWSTPIRVNDDPMGIGVDQFQPTIKVRSDGTIGVTWMDRRNDPDNYFYDLYYAQSTDGGVTWSPNQRVSDVINDPDPVVDYKGVDDMGYKYPLVFGTDYVIAGWIRTLVGTFNADYHIDRGIMKAVTTPTLTPVGSPTRTVTANPSATRTATTSSTPSATMPVGTPTPCTLQFSDVQPDNTFYANIRCLACRGVISGYADGTFKPGNNITRGQIAKMVSNAAGFNEPVSGWTFEDVPFGQTFYVWIQRLTLRGVMSGYPCGARAGEPCVPPLNRPYFRPGENATRGQISKIVANAAGFNDPVTGQFYADVTADNPFYNEIMRLTNRGVMSGYPCGGPGEPCDSENRPYFRWGNAVTRGQASKIVANTFFPGCQTP